MYLNNSDSIEESKFSSPIDLNSLILSLEHLLGHADIASDINKSAYVHNIWVWDERLPLSIWWLLLLWASHSLVWWGALDIIRLLLVLTVALVASWSLGGVVLVVVLGGLVSPVSLFMMVLSWLSSLGRSGSSAAGASSSHLRSLLSADVSKPATSVCEAPATLSSSHTWVSSWVSWSVSIEVRPSIASSPHKSLTTSSLVNWKLVVVEVRIFHLVLLLLLIVISKPWQGCTSSHATSKPTWSIVSVSEVLHWWRRLLSLIKRWSAAVVSWASTLHEHWWSLLVLEAWSRCEPRHPLAHHTSSALIELVAIQRSEILVLLLLLSYASWVSLTISVVADDASCSANLSHGPLSVVELIVIVTWCVSSCHLWMCSSVVV